MAPPVWETPNSTLAGADPYQSTMPDVCATASPEARDHIEVWMRDG